MSTDKHTLSISVAKQLGEQIVSGRFKPGEKLREAMVAREFETSRGPAREALRLLASEGVVELRPRQGAYVRQFSKRELIEIVEVRGSLFVTACRLFARRLGSGELGPETLDQMEEFRTKSQSANLEKADAGALFATETVAFRTHIMRHCGNSVLENQYEKLAGLTSGYYLHLTHRESQHRERLMRLGRILIDALQAGEVEIAGKIAQQLTHHNQTALLASLDEIGDGNPAKHFDPTPLFDEAGS